MWGCLQSTRKSASSASIILYTLLHYILFLNSADLQPTAVAVRFGIGTDFFINVILTICGCRWTLIFRTNFV